MPFPGHCHPLTAYWGGIVATKFTEHVGVGDLAHDFTLPTLDGEMISLSDYKGKRVILFMWASW
jgi:peroxiredoxin